MSWLQQALTATAGHGLLGSRADMPAGPPGDEQFRSFLEHLDRHRLLGLAAAATAAGALPLTDQQAETLLGAHVDAMCGCLMLEATLLDIRADLLREGITPRVVKGPASAHLDYPDPSLRCFGDLDLLVRPQDVEGTKRALERRGYRRAWPEPRPGFDRRFGKGVTYIDDDGTNVDLHRTFVMGPYGLRVDLDELWATGARFALAGREVDALTADHRLLAACYNAILGDRTPRLSTLRDIAQLCLSGDVDPDEVLATGGRWRAQGVLARGVRAAWQSLDLADVVALSAWATRYQDGPDDKMLTVYHDDRAGYSGLSWATARILPARDRLAFLAALAFPRGGRLGERGWGIGQRVRRAARGYARAQR